MTARRKLRVAPPGNPQEVEGPCGSEGRTRTPAGPCLRPPPRIPGQDDAGLFSLQAEAHATIGPSRARARARVSCISVCVVCVCVCVCARCVCPRACLVCAVSRRGMGEERARALSAGLDGASQGCGAVGWREGAIRKDRVCVCVCGGGVQGARRALKEVGAVLRGVVLRGVVLRGVVLRGVVLWGVVLRGVVLRGLDYRA